MITVWGRRNSLNVQKVMWTLGELDLDYTRHDISGSFGKTDTDEYGSLNPNRKVPTIEDDGLVMWESNAIVRYLVAQYSKGILQSHSIKVMAIANQWMDWQQTELYAALGPVFMAICRVPKAEQDQVVIAQHTLTAANAFATLEPYLDKNDYIAGDTLTIGDIPIGCCLWRYYSLPIERPNLPNLRTYYERLAERPAFQKHVTFPFGASLEEWTELEQAGAGA
ncbi:MAG: glutathione S-transferase family protein [Chloroflexota bacterium]